MSEYVLYVHSRSATVRRFSLRERLKILFGSRLTIQTEELITMESGELRTVTTVDGCEPAEVIGPPTACGRYEQPPVLLWSSIKE